MIVPMESFKKFLHDHKHFHYDWLYEGDLETDFLRILGEIHRAANESPVGFDIDFRT